MKLFRGRRDEAQVPEVSFQLALPSQQRKQPIRIDPISLSAEQKSILETPVDPRVGRIMNEIVREKMALELPVDARRIVRFPHSDTGALFPATCLRSRTNYPTCCNSEILAAR